MLAVNWRIIASLLIEEERSFAAFIKGDVQHSPKDGSDWFRILRRVLRAGFIQVPLTGMQIVKRSKLAQLRIRCPIRGNGPAQIDNPWLATMETERDGRVELLLDRHLYGHLQEPAVAISPVVHFRSGWAKSQASCPRVLSESPEPRYVSADCR